MEPNLRNLEKKSLLLCYQDTFHFWLNEILKICYPLLQNVCSYMNHTSSEKRNNLVPRYSNLSHVQAVSQLIWAHTSPSKSWILWTCLAMFLTFRRCMGFYGCPPFSSHPSIELNWIQLNWISLFIISYVIIKLHNSSHLLNVCLNNANRMQGKNVLACTIDTDFKYVINMCSICVPHKFWNLMMAEFWKKICW